MVDSLAKGARWTAGRLFSDLNPNNKTESIIDHRYHADFASFNKSIEDKVKGTKEDKVKGIKGIKPTLTPEQAREKLIQYRELVKAQYDLGGSGNLSLQEENKSVIAHATKESEKDAHAVRNITTVTPPDDGEARPLISRLSLPSLESSSPRPRSNSTSSVDSSTSRGSNDVLGYRSSRFSSTSDSNLPPPSSLSGEE